MLLSGVERKWPSSLYKQPCLCAPPLPIILLLQAKAKEKWIRPALFPGTPNNRLFSSSWGVSSGRAPSPENVQLPTPWCWRLGTTHSNTWADLNCRGIAQSGRMASRTARAPAHIRPYKPKSKSWTASWTEQNLFFKQLFITLSRLKDINSLKFWKGYETCTSIFTAMRNWSFYYLGYLEQVTYYFITYCGPFRS